MGVQSLNFAPKFSPKMGVFSLKILFLNEKIYYYVTSLTISAVAAASLALRAANNASLTPISFLTTVDCLPTILYSIVPSLTLPHLTALHVNSFVLSDNAAALQHH